MAMKSSSDRLITSFVGINLIKEFESFRGVAYLDPVGIPTIGWGTTRIAGYAVTLGMTINEAVAELLLKGDLQKIEDRINQLILPHPKQNEFDALVSFEYNTGGLISSTLLKVILAGGTVTEDLFTRWNKATIHGVITPLEGLTRRRKMEFALYVKN